MKRVTTSTRTSPRLRKLVEDRIHNKKPTTPSSLLAVQSNGKADNGDSSSSKVRKQPAADPVQSLDNDDGTLPFTPSKQEIPSKRRRVVTPLSVASTDPVTSNSMATLTVTVTPIKFLDSDFEDLQVSPEELRPSTTLTTGQCFHWKPITTVGTDSSTTIVKKEEPTPQKLKSKETNKKQSASAWGTHNATEWIGTLRVSTAQSLVVVIRETPTTTLYRVLYPPASGSNGNVHQFLRDYFQLDTPLKPLYEAWSQQDPRLKRIAQCIRGVRIVNQNPWECLASFICSSNNNIPRITQILASIRREYGTLLMAKGQLDGEQMPPEDIYSFPSLDDLQQRATDADLREKCGMGYRAKYILETMKVLQDLGGEAYLESLKQKQGSSSADQVQEALTQFSGVGRKVADCVALFSLKQAEAIPVDTHVWNIACRDYDPDGELKNVKSLTPTVYAKVGDIYRNIFLEKAGWAHSLLFVAELPSFRPVLPKDMVQEMDKFRAEEQARKKAAKAKKKET